MGDKDKKEKDLAATARLLEVIRQETPKRELFDDVALKEKISSLFLDRKSPFPLSQVKVGLEIAESYCILVSLETNITRSRLLGFRIVKYKKGNYLTGIKTIMEGITGRYKLVVGINNPSLVIRQIRMPGLSRKEMKEAIFWEAKRHIPYEMDSVTFDFQVLGRREGVSDILLVAVPRGIVDKLLNACYGAKLKLHITDVAPLALMNAYLANYPIAPNETIVLLNLEDRLGMINIYTEGGTLFNRYLSLPPVSKEVLKDLNAWNSVLFEIKRALTYYEDQYKPNGFARIVLSGCYGHTDLKGYLEQEVGLPVEVFNPWHNIQVDKTLLDGKLVEENSPRLAIAVGLALR
ncbi:MAG: pilus assembly protein PilM [Candidatus Desulfofervidaceae bacterium]|nr:pilus assembly protein PilM [Candidatus Desulfofervidaceae bacterium]